MKRICVFCGSSLGAKPIYREAAEKTGRSIVERKLDLVYGAGSIGLMGVVADSVLEAGGSVTGVIPYALVQREVGHASLSDLRVVDSMHERKALMADMADGFLALPGGFGTFEEFLEIVTWAQLGMHAKPCALLNVDGYYDPLLCMVKTASEEGFIHPEYLSLILVDSNIDRLLDRMETYEAPLLEKWIDRRTS